MVGGTLSGAPSCVALSFLTSFCAARSPGTAPFFREGIFSAIFSRKKVYLPVTFSVPAFQPESMYADVTCTCDSQALADARCAWIGDGGAANVRRFSGTTSRWVTAVGTIPFGTPADRRGCTPFAHRHAGLRRARLHRLSGPRPLRGRHPRRQSGEHHPARRSVARASAMAASGCSAAPSANLRASSPGESCSRRSAVNRPQVAASVNSRLYPWRAKARSA